MADSEDAALLRRRARRRLIGAIALVVLAVVLLPIVFDKDPKPISQDIVIQIPSQNSARFNTRVVPAAPDAASSEVRNADEAAAKTAPPVTRVEASKADAARAEPAKTEAAKAEAAKAGPSKPEASKAEASRESELPEAREAAKPAAAAKPLAQAKGTPAPTEVPKAAAAPRDNEAQRAPAATSEDAYVVPLGAFLNQANVKTLQAKVTLAGVKSYSEIQKVAKGEQIRVRAGPFASRDAAERARAQLQAAGLTVGPVTRQ